MLSNLKSSIQLSKGEKAYVVAYAIVIAVAAGLTVFVMAGVEGDAALPNQASFFSIWAVISGIIGGALALYAARGWLGMSGSLGLARAVVGSTAAALIAAVIAGSLIMPIYGTFYAPVLLATEFVSSPLIAVGWYAAMLRAHYLMTVLTKERQWVRPEQEAVSRTLAASLSSLSRAQLYRQRN